MAANRGEIAIRIFRAANELGLRTVPDHSTGQRAADPPLKTKRPTPRRGPRAAARDVFFATPAISIHGPDGFNFTQRLASNRRF